jgi:hypothetical protein
MDADEAARKAKIRNRNAAKRAPLLAWAGLLPEWTPEGVMASYDAFVARQEEMRERWRSARDYMRRALTALVGAERMAEWEHTIGRIYPAGDTYAMDYYRQRYREMHGCDVPCAACPKEACPIAPSRVYALLDGVAPDEELEQDTACLSAENVAHTEG